MYVKLIDHTGDDAGIVKAARVSTVGRESLESGEKRGLIRYLVRENHCYDPETEILTRDRGWVKFPDVTMDDVVLARDVAGNIAWESPTEVVDEYYEGDMVHLSGRNLDLVVTPNHRMLAEHRTHKGWQSPQIHYAGEFTERPYKVYRGGGVKQGVDVDPAVAKLLGFIVADGSVSRSNISFHLSKKRKINWLKEVTGNSVVGGHNDTYRVPLGWSDELTRLARLTYSEDGSRKFPEEVLTNWSSTSLSNLLDGFLEGDGHHGESNRVSAVTVSRVLAEQLQVLATLTGGAATVHGPFDYSERSIESGFAKTVKPLYNVVFASDRHLKVRVGWTSKEREKQVKVLPYKGRIHCVTVPSGIVYVRRNGHTLWSGNTSPLEHNSMTFFVEAPIFVAREFMRHRIGWSFNETSGRYKVLEDNFYYPPVERPLVQKGKAADYDLYPGSGYQKRKVEDFTDYAYQTAWYAYQSMLDAGIAREVARNVLPVGIYTQFYATCNLHSLLKFLDLRTADDALWEIRWVANEMKRLAEPLFPVAMGAWEEFK